ncbi:MAG: hypothetical protein QM705_15175 [Ancrocorticia sp.]
MAASAVEHAAQEVVVDDVALTAFHSCVHDLLYSFEEFWGDERFVAPGEGFSFEGDHAEVVRVAEHLGELAAGDGLFWVLRCAPCCESLIG